MHFKLSRLKYEKCLMKDEHIFTDFTAKKFANFMYNLFNYKSFLLLHLVNKGEVRFPSSD